MKTEYITIINNIKQNKIFFHLIYNNEKRKVKQKLINFFRLKIIIIIKQQSYITGAITLIV